MYIPNEVYKLMELDPEFKAEFGKKIKETAQESIEMADKISHPETSDVPMIEPFIFEQYKTNYRTKNLNIDGNVLLGSESSESTLFIPPEVTEFAEMSFKSEEPFKENDIGKAFKIVLHPTGLKKIGKEAFKKSHLYSLDVKDPEMFAYSGGWRGGHFYQISKGLVLFPETLEEIGESAFALCQDFAGGRYMILPSNLKKVSRGAFSYCSSLVGVYFNGAKEVSEFCFNSCESLKSVVLDDCVESIESYAFAVCYLKKIVFSVNLKKIEDRAFFLSKLKTVTLPPKLEYIGESCFDSCRCLTEVEMSDNVSFIGNRAFYGCTQLRKVRLSNKLTVIPQECFDGCKRMEDVVIPENVIRIESKAFRNCKSLVSIIIPKNVTTIDKFAFRGCNCEQLVIYGVRGSYAEQFAREHNIKFDDVKNKVVVSTICEACGTNLQKGSEFCHKCGTKVVAKPFITI